MHKTAHESFTQQHSPVLGRLLSEQQVVSVTNIVSFFSISLNLSLIMSLKKDVLTGFILIAMEEMNSGHKLFRSRTESKNEIGL